MKKSEYITRTKQQTHENIFTNVQHVRRRTEAPPKTRRFLRSLFGVEHFFSFGVHGAEREHGVGKDGGQKREELEEEGVGRRGQQVPVFRPSGGDGVHHGVDHHVGALEPALARGGEVLVGHVDVLPVEEPLAFFV